MLTNPDPGPRGDSLSRSGGTLASCFGTGVHGTKLLQWAGGENVINKQPRQVELESFEGWKMRPLRRDQCLWTPAWLCLSLPWGRSLLSTHCCLLLSVSRTPLPRPDLPQRLNSKPQLPKSSCPSTCELPFMFLGSFLCLRHPPPTSASMSMYSFCRSF